MSAFGGIYCFNGAPVDERMLIALGNRLAAGGPDGGREVYLDSLGMTYRTFHTNRESRLERQPLASPEGHLLAWDGRLDNRDELLAVLGNELRDRPADAALVMAAYRKCGADFLPRLAGDFALSLWNPLSRTLLLARDPFGGRTLYYHVGRDRIVWSSDLRAILDVPGVDTEINDNYIAGFLTRFPETHETPYRDIHSVAHGSAVIVRDSHLQAYQFWKPDGRAEELYRSDAEYEERFRHLLREAVRCRLRADGTVIAQLSGGLDSSAIVCIGDRLIASGEAEAPA